MITIQLEKELLSAEGQMMLELDLQIERKEFVAICGPSGSGKTTLLRLIAGLAKPEQGQIKFENTTWLDTTRRINLPPQKRQLGLVFQDYALFPNMTVKGNLEYALNKKQSSEIITELMEVMELETLADRYPPKLSGGQQQRVALARALVQKPGILLLDEPLSALDPEMRLKLQNYILKVHKAYNLTTVLVSHDQREVSKMADRVLNMRLGKITSDDRNATLNNSNESINLNGKIRAIKITDDKAIIEIRVGQNIIHLKTSVQETRDRKPGDNINITCDGFQIV